MRQEDDHSLKLLPPLPSWKHNWSENDNHNGNRPHVSHSRRHQTHIIMMPMLEDGQTGAINFGREKKKAEAGLRTNSTFKNWFHRIHVSENRVRRVGRHNPDINPRQVRDAYQEWLAPGKAETNLMYTILRLTCESEEKLGDLIKIGERMDILKKGSFPGLRKNSNWFACTLASDSDFETHLEEIGSSIELFSMEIQNAVGGGIFASIDVAIGIEDFGKSPYTSVGLDTKFLKFLTSLGIALEVTIYRP